MNSSSKPSKKLKRRHQPVQPKECIYCGSKNIEHISVHGVGVMRICKDCREEQ